MVLSKTDLAKLCVGRAVVNRGQEVGGPVKRIVELGGIACSMASIRLSSTNSAGVGRIGENAAPHGPTYLKVGSFQPYGNLHQSQFQTEGIQ